MLSPVEAQHKLTTEGGIVVLKASSLDSNEAYAELNSPEARRVAIAVAARLGVPDPRINNNVTIYPVDGTGTVITDQVNQKIAAFHADVPIVRRLV